MMPPPPRKQPHVRRSIVVGVATVSFALAVGVASLVTGRSPVAAISAVVDPKPPTCHQQYETWKRRTTPELKEMTAALHRATKVSNAHSLHQALAELKSGGKSASRDASLLRRAYAMPRCADPAGYYGRAMALVIQVGNDVQSISGIFDLAELMTPLQGIRASEHSLTRELDRTVGVQR